jgi:RNA polymerase sigma-70 factor (sigma-E family)
MSRLTNALARPFMPPDVRLRLRHQRLDEEAARRRGWILRAPEVSVTLVKAVDSPAGRASLGRRRLPLTTIDDCRGVEPGRKGGQMPDLTIDTDSDSDKPSAASADGFDLFMAERWPRLVRSAYLLTGDPHDAEDLAQTALAKIFSHWHRVRRADNVDAYVQRVLINCNSTRFRKRRVHEHPVGDVPPGLRLVGDHADELGERSPFMTALAGLPPRQRTVVVLRFYEDLTEAQTAAAMGCTVGTVKSQTARALARLRGHTDLAPFIPSDSRGGAA